MSLRRQVGLGLFWLTVASIASRGLGLLRKLVLARLLVPSDFGLVGYASLIIGILGLFTEMGFSSALIYRQDDVDEAANSTFFLIVASSVLLYGLAWASAPWVAGFFRNAALVSVLRVLSISLVISSVSQVPLTLMARGMGFKAKVLPEIAGGLVGSGLSVALALMGHGVWAIIYGQLITSLIISILVWFFCPWRPRLRLDLRLLRQLWDYGRHIVGSQVMVFLITNVDDAFVGRFKGDEGLGIYSLAYDLSNLPATHMSRIVGQVMFPAFSRVQDDLGRLRSAFFTSTRYIALAAIPITVITMVFAEDFIIEAYGKKWYQAVTPLQLLAVYGLARSIAVNMGNVFKAGGRPKWLLYIAAWRLATMAALLYPAIRFAGINGVAGLSALVAIVDFVLSLVLTNRILRAPWRRYSETLVPMLLAAVGTTMLCHQGYLYIGHSLHPFIGLPLMGGLALAIYGGLMYLYDPDLRALVARALATLQEYRRTRLARSQARA